MTNPAPSSALRFEKDLPVPRPKAGQVLVRVHAATVTRDELTWPEMYRGGGLMFLGHDFAGVVVEVGPEVSNALRPGVEVYGLAEPKDVGVTWAEYAAVNASEIAVKPASLSWEEAATVPMSALTAWQALFVQAGAPAPAFTAAVGGVASGPKDGALKVLITGSSGAVGPYLVQLANLAGLHVVAAVSSKTRNGNEELLRSLGAHEVFEYEELGDRKDEFDIIIDTIGGGFQEKCWSLIKITGTFVTIDSSSFDLYETSRDIARSFGKEQVKALFFIVDGIGAQLEQIGAAFDRNLLRTFVAETWPLEKAREAYEAGNQRTTRRGKIVLTI